MLVLAVTLFDASCVRHSPPLTDVLGREQRVLEDRTVPAGSVVRLEVTEQGSWLQVRSYSRPSCERHRKGIYVDRLRTTRKGRVSQRGKSLIWLLVSGAATLGVLGTINDDTDMVALGGVPLGLGVLVLAASLAGAKDDVKDSWDSPEPFFDREPQPCGNERADSRHSVLVEVINRGVVIDTAKLLAGAGGVSTMNVSELRAAVQTCGGLSVRVTPVDREGETAPKELKLTASPGPLTEKLRVACCAVSKADAFNDECMSSCKRVFSVDGCFTARRVCKKLARSEDVDESIAIVCDQRFDQCMRIRAVAETDVHRCAMACVLGKASQQCVSQP